MDEYISAMDEQEIKEFYKYYNRFYKSDGDKPDPWHDFAFPTYDQFKDVVRETEKKEDIELDSDSYSREYIKWMWLARLNNKSLTHSEVIGLFWGHKNPNLDWV